MFKAKVRYYTSEINVLENPVAKYHTAISYRSFLFNYFHRPTYVGIVLKLSFVRRTRRSNSQAIADH